MYLQVRLIGGGALAALLLWSSCGRLGFEQLDESSTPDAGMGAPMPDALQGDAPPGGQARDTGAPFPHTVPTDAGPTDPVPDDAGAPMFPLDLTIDGLAHCIHTLSLNSGLILNLEVGTYLLRAVSGAVTYANGSDCRWGYWVGVKASGGEATQKLSAPLPNPPRCKSPHLYETRAGAEAATVGVTITFTVTVAGPVSFGLLDSYCDDNSGAMNLRLEPLP